MATTMNVMQKGKNPNCFDRNPKEDWKAIILRNGKNVVGPILVDEDEQVQGNPTRFEEEKEIEVERHVKEKVEDVPAPMVLGSNSYYSK